MKQYFIYMTTNLINGKRYIGKHWGELDDGYLGSGTELRKDINTLGKDNFTREILCFTSSEEENCEKEKEYITHYKAVEREDFYNVHVGGNGGNTIAGWSDERRQQHSELMSLLTSGVNNGMYGKHHTEETKEKIRQNRDVSYTKTPEFRTTMSRVTSGERNGMYGKNHTEESIAKMREKAQARDYNSSNNPNSRKIKMFKDEEHTQLIKEFECIKDALIYVGSTGKDYSGISKAYKNNKKYKGYYWEKE